MALKRGWNRGFLDEEIVSWKNGRCVDAILKEHSWGLVQTPMAYIQTGSVAVLLLARSLVRISCSSSWYALLGRYDDGRWARTLTFITNMRDSGVHYIQYYMAKREGTYPEAQSDHFGHETSLSHPVLRLMFLSHSQRKDVLPRIPRQKKRSNGWCSNLSGLTCLLYMFSFSMLFITNWVIFAYLCSYLDCSNIGIGDWRAAQALSPVPI